MLVASSPAMAIAQSLTESDGRQVVEEVARRSHEQYVFPEQGTAMAETLRSKLKRGEFDSLTDGDKLAKQLSDDLQRVSGDRHLNVEYTEKPSADEDAKKDPEFEARERQRYYGAHLNFGFNSVQRLDDNIGVLELSVFAPVDMGGDTAFAAMQFLAHTSALIVDLRRNGGGDGEMAKFLMSYLFDSGSRPISRNRRSRMPFRAVMWNLGGENGLCSSNSLTQRGTLIDSNSFFESILIVLIRTAAASDLRIRRAFPSVFQILENRLKLRRDVTFSGSSVHLCPHESPRVPH